MVDRQYSLNASYRFGFNGKENDDEVKGGGNQQDYGMRIYDSRLGKFLSIDPLAGEYPWNSTYAFAENEPIANIDVDGLEKYKVTIRTFLPYTYVWEPQAQDLIDKANTRWYPQYQNVNSHGGYKTEQQFEIDFYTKSFDYSFSVPEVQQKNLQTNEIATYESSGIGSKFTTVMIFDQRANIFADIAAKNPATPWFLPTTAIDYGLSISVMTDGTWILKGKWDGFPALEIFLEDVETGQVDLIHFDNTSDAGRDLKDRKNPEQILDLFPANPFARNGDVKIDKIGTIGENPQKDRQTPSSKVEENNKRFSNQSCNCGPPASPLRDKTTAGNITEF